MFLVLGITGIFYILIYISRHLTKERRAVEKEDCVLDYLDSLYISDFETDYDRTPVSPSRPDQNYSLRAEQIRTERVEPVLTVLTATHNTKYVFKDTATMIKEQSFRSLRWVIVDDHSDSGESIDRLREAQLVDRRIVLLNNTEHQGVSNCRQVALEYLKNNPTKYFAFMDDDDLFELTGYEKCVLMLESSLNIDMCGFYSTGFGERNYTWYRGFHNRIGNLFSNTLTNGYVVRSSALFESNCKFESNFNGGMEDWEFLLCLAAHGKWGATVPEVLHWYRQNPKSSRETKWPLLYEKNLDATLSIRRKYEPLLTPFPSVMPRIFDESDEIVSNFPFKNYLKSDRAVLVVLDSFAVSEKNIVYLDLVRNLVAEGYHISVVCTSARPGNTNLRKVFEQYTVDIFVLPHLMRLIDSPRFFKYIIESRNAKIVLLDRSLIGYVVMPWLSTYFKDIVLAAFVEGGDFERTQKEFMPFFGRFESYFDYLIVSSPSIKIQLAKNAFAGDRILAYSPEKVTHRSSFIRELFRTEERVKVGIDSEAFVLLHVGNGFISHMSEYILDAFRESITRHSADRRSKKGVFYFLSINSGVEPFAKTTVSAGYKLVVRFFDATSESISSLVGISDVMCFADAQDRVTIYQSESVSPPYQLKNIAMEGSTKGELGVKSKKQFVSKLYNIFKSSLSTLSKLNQPRCRKRCCAISKRSRGEQFDIKSLTRKREIPASAIMMKNKLRKALSYWAEDLTWDSDYALLYSRLVRMNLTIPI